MKILGNYVELWPKTANTPLGSIKKYVQADRARDADLIRRYLSSGETIISMMSVDVDVIEGTTEILGGSSVLTDGVWVWRESLAYYYHRYNLRLPPDFIQAVRGLKYQVPPVLDQRGAEFSKELRKILRPSK